MILWIEDHISDKNLSCNVCDTIEDEAISCPLALMSSLFNSCQSCGHGHTTLTTYLAQFMDCGLT